MFRIARYHKTVASPIRCTEEEELIHALATWNAYKGSLCEGERCTLSMWHGERDTHGFRVWQIIDRRKYTP